MIDTNLFEMVHAELSTADASTAQAITVYNRDQTARPVAADERLAITDVRVCTTAAAKLDVFFDKNSNGNVDAGERVWSTDNGTNSGSQLAFHTPIFGPKGIGPSVKAGGAGAFIVILSGYIVKAG